MKIDDQLIESLLYEEESKELDVKLKSYRFTKATDNEKSELLKDILSFANAWRRSDAYILLGVQEVKGGRNKVVGISDLLDDAVVQQFINSKTNSPINFSYRNLTFEEKNIALIHIPIQKRPFYLKKNYGKLEKDKVYVRRGSSTAIATPTEISKMGIALQAELGNPDLEVYFADPKTRKRLSDKVKIESLDLETPKISEIKDYSPRKASYMIASFHNENRHYYREIVNYTRVTKLVTSLYIAVCNSGSSVAQDVRLEIKIDKAGGNVVAIDPYDYPELPNMGYDRLDFRPVISEKTFVSEVAVNDIDDSWIIEARADKIQPKATYWFQDSFYLGSFESCEIPLNITIFCDDLSIPKSKQLNVSVLTKHKQASLEDILELERERFLSTPEGQRYLQRGEEE